MSTSKFGIPRWLLRKVASKEEIEHLESVIKKFVAYSNWKDRLQISNYKDMMVNRYINSFDHGIYRVRCKLGYDDGVVFCQVGPWGMVDVRIYDRSVRPKKGDVVTWFARGYEMPEHRLNYFMDSHGNIFRTNKAAQLKFTRIDE